MKYNCGKYLLVDWSMAHKSQNRGEDRNVEYWILPYRYVKYNIVIYC